MIPVNCGCGWNAQMPDKYAVRKGKCPNCKGEIMMAGSPIMKQIDIKAVGSNWGFNMQAGRNATSLNIVGIVSFIYGFVALSICWIPFINYTSVALAVLSIILGIFGSIIAYKYKRDHELSTIGVGFSILAIVVFLSIKLYIRYRMYQFQEQMNNIFP